MPVLLHVARCRLSGGRRLRYQPVLWRTEAREATAREDRSRCITAVTRGECEARERVACTPPRAPELGEVRVDE
jgi:hypothetical protein